MSDETSGLRIAVAGASGALGRELLAVLSDRRFPAGEIKAFATDRSLGEEVDFDGDFVPIEAAPKTLRGFDALIVCTPQAAALDLVREALQSEVPCIDASGAMAGSEEVPLYVADLCAPSAIENAPLIASPAGVALAWSHLLAAVEGSAGVKRVVGTVLYAASRAGRAGIDALSNETIHLLNQKEPPPSDAFANPVAFDCFPLPASGAPNEGEADNAAQLERELVRDMQRLVSRDIRVSAAAVQVPTFAGDGSSLAIETRSPLPIASARELFAKAPALEVWDEEEITPSTRDSGGRDVAVVGRLREDPSVEHGLLLWLTADTLRLAALNAAKIAEARLGV
ncbi:MAG: Asd/ArgC dimerization domain-containing protein [Myxococcota bacterium]|jgi:aspartate-semialdehyde dehydrogenase|nr:Asd/ArgC dimerization domain-containing protein [Myxococcota bacterium]